MKVAYRRAGLITVGGVGLGAMVGALTVYSIAPLPLEIPYGEYTPRPMKTALREAPAGIMDQGSRPARVRNDVLFERASAVVAPPAAPSANEAPDLHAADLDEDVPIASDSDPGEPIAADEPSAHSDAGIEAG